MAFRHSSAAGGVDKVGPLGGIYVTKAANQISRTRPNPQEHKLHGFVVHYIQGCDALDLHPAAHQPGLPPPTAGLVLTWADLVVASIGLVALVGCLALLLVGRDIPVWLATLPGSVLGYYAGAVRKA